MHANYLNTTVEIFWHCCSAFLY